MSQEHHDWITKNKYNKYENSFGKCSEICDEMLKVFPNLIKVRGHYYCSVWGERMHWWLQDYDGKIVDPTSSQFPSKGGGVYIPWDESRKEPTGKCPNCGNYCYDHHQFCNEICYKEYACSVMI